MLTALTDRFPSLGWVSLLDILVVAVLVYQLLSLVRGTRAAQMLAGASIVAAGMWAGARLGLPTVNWILESLLPYAAIGVIIIFSAEIRRGLAKIGRSLRFSRSPRLEGVGGPYDDVVLAVNLFSQNQTGALIVIEREIGLRTYIESGVALDAYLSYDLLATIFRPSAPLHDGAVIVRDDRIAAAACFLPLSVNPVLSAQVGTRHRAGIGITEETDAIAIIVSEETGAISLATAGNIERSITVEQLRQRLSALLHRYVPPSALPTMTPAAEDAEEARQNEADMERGA